MHLEWVRLLLEVIIGIGVAVIAGVVCLSAYRKSTVEMLQGVNEALRQSNEQYKSDIEACLEVVANLEKAFHTQEARIYVIEVDRERSTKILKTARKEIELLEKMVDQAYTFLLKRDAKDEAERVASLRAELIEFRHQSEEDLDSWNKLNSAALAYIDKPTKESASDLLERIRTRRLPEAIERSLGNKEDKRSWMQ